MPIQSQSDSRLRSRPISGLHALRALTALTMFRLSASPIQGITVHSASSGPSVPSTHHNQGEALP
jgi:hypothetical protein